MFISVLYMFRAAMCPSSGELIVSKIWYMSLCIDDRLVCRFGWVFISILYMFRAAMCPSSGELNVSKIWYMSLCTDDSFVCRFGWVFTSFLYMFQSAMFPSSGELIVSIRHLVYVTLYRWPFGVQVCLHNKPSSIQSGIYQMSYWYN